MWLGALLGLVISVSTSLAATDDRPVASTDGPVDYEAFGAIGDGIADDLPAIVKAHEFANERGLPVKTKPGATYNLGRRSLTAVISTDTDWGTSRFTIVDREVENHRTSLFVVRSKFPSLPLSIPRLTRDQRNLDVHPARDCWVRVEDNRKRLFIREGLNQNQGLVQRDCFILHRDGSIEGDIDWEYDAPTGIVALPLDEHPLLVKGGIFTTTANQLQQPGGYDYWARNIAVERSNTTVEQVTHRVIGEGEFGNPYRGFISVTRCANVTLRGCFVTGHKIYSTIGAAGKPVNMGTYDLNASEVVNLTVAGCRMDNINDKTLWGVIGTNFCKNILLEDCILSRMDTHEGVSGTYTFRRCTLGYAGLNAIGRGTLVVEDCTLYGRTLIRLRSDYGSTWDGTVTVRNCRWTPDCGAVIQPYIMDTINPGQHDFGYPCFMPREITIDGLVIDDTHHPSDYVGPYIFTDPDGGKSIAASHPFPYRPTERVTIRRLTTASGKRPLTSTNSELNRRVQVIEIN